MHGVPTKKIERTRHDFVFISEPPKISKYKWNKMRKLSMKHSKDVSRMMDLIAVDVLRAGINTRQYTEKELIQQRRQARIKRKQREAELRSEAMDILRYSKRRAVKKIMDLIEDSENSDY